MFRRRDSEAKKSLDSLYLEFRRGRRSAPWQMQVCLVAWQPKPGILVSQRLFLAATGQGQLLLQLHAFVDKFCKAS